MGTEIANCEPVESVKLSQNEAQDAEPGAVVLPMHLKELYEQKHSRTNTRRMLTGIRSS